MPNETQTVDNKTQDELVLPSIIVRKRDKNGQHILHPERGYPNGKILKQCPLTKLQPGENAVPSEHWEMLKEHKVTKRYIELGFIKVVPRAKVASAPQAKETE